MELGGEAAEVDAHGVPVDFLGLLLREDVLHVPFKLCHVLLALEAH